jgi:tRNA U34 5-methylaminomethyl-2-thiouridine-forming methyltransferase MnmC
MEQFEIITTDDGSSSVRVPALSETYHSSRGAVQESQHVFIEAGLRHINGSSVEQIKVLEIGMGTGLNALLAWTFAQQEQVHIRYHSIEPYPLPGQVIVQLNYPEYIHKQGAQHIFEKIHSCEWSTMHALGIYFSFMKHQVALELFEIDLVPDAVFFDAFAPSKQPEVWSVENLMKIHAALRPGGVLVTYCAQGQFKRNLKSLGFCVEALPGPPGKFEMVRATKT